jgi:hypothetical protein
VVYLRIVVMGSGPLKLHKQVGLVAEHAPHGSQLQIPGLQSQTHDPHFLTHYSCGHHFQHCHLVLPSSYHHDASCDVGGQA